MRGAFVKWTDVAKFFTRNKDRILAFAKQVIDSANDPVKPLDYPAPPQGVTVDAWQPRCAFDVLDEQREKWTPEMHEAYDCKIVSDHLVR